MFVLKVSELLMCIFSLQECLKPVMYSDNEDAKNLSRNVLYTALHVGLTLISPFMPFLSEELFQRLPPRTANQPPSICVTSYPESEEVSCCGKCNFL